jgi:hypothetical protein
VRYDLITGDVQGLRTLFVVPRIPDDAPERVREGIARRRLATVTGRCPCGAERPRLNREQRRKVARRKARYLGIAEIAHENDCPAISNEVERALGRWSA